MEFSRQIAPDISGIFFLGGGRGGGFPDRIREFGAGPVNEGLVRLLKGRPASVKAVSKELQETGKAMLRIQTSATSAPKSSEKEGFGRLHHNLQEV